LPACQQASVAAVPKIAKNTQRDEEPFATVAVDVALQDTINFPKAPARFPERAGAEFFERRVTGRRRQRPVRGPSSAQLAASAQMAQMQQQLARRSYSGMIRVD
jgi:hypothetical protein